jgi:hypothetical protein
MRILYTVYRIPNKLFRLSSGTCGKNVGLYGDHERPLQSWTRVPVCRAYDTRRGWAHSRATSKTATWRPFCVYCSFAFDDTNPVHARQHS